MMLHRPRERSDDVASRLPGSPAERHMLGHSVERPQETAA